jgi:hypothetical protein
MANANSTQANDLLGKTVELTRSILGSSTFHRGRVIAVISVLPGSRANPSIMVEEDSSRCDYFDLEDITIQAIL